MFKLIQNKSPLTGLIFSLCAFYSHAQMPITANSFIRDQFKEMLHISYGNIVAADIDADGKPDIVTAGYFNNRK